MRKTNYFLVISLLTTVTLHAFSLKDGFKYALENDIDSKVNENNLRNIEFDQDIANSLLRPKVDFSATVERSRFTPDKLTPGDTPHKNADEYEFKVTQPIFDGFESKYEQDLQENRFKSAVYYLKESQGRVALDYATAYINTLREKDLLSLSTESLTISENVFNKVYKKVQAGYGTKLEFEEAKGDLAENRVNVDIQRINFKDTLENLKFYVQTDFDSTELRKPNFHISLPKNLDDAIKLALENNPSINVSKLNVNVAVAEERKKDKDFYPDLNFVATYKLNNALYAEENTESNEYTIGLEFNYNLYNGGKDIAEAKKALQNIKEKQFLIKKSEYQIKNKVRLAWNSYRLNKEKKENLEQYLIVKKDILDSTLKEFDLGLKQLNALLEIHIDYINVKKDLISNSYDLLSAQYRILDATGQLSEVLQDKLPTLKNIDTSHVMKDLYNDTQYSFNTDKDVENKNLQVLSIQNKPKIFKMTSIQEPEVNKLNLAKKYNIHQNKKNMFKNRFLNASPNKYTINLALLGTKNEAESFLRKNNISDKAFSFQFGKSKTYEKVMMGVYNSKEEAKKALNRLSKKLKRNAPRIERVSIKQKLYHKYNSLIYSKKEKVLRNNIDSNVKVYKASTSIIARREKSSATFKDRFLNASANKYTINLALLDTKRQANSFLKVNSLLNEAFSFQFGKSKTYEKVMMGIYNSKEEAKKALNRLSKKLKRNAPRIERISIKQKLYFKYNNTFNLDRNRSI